MKQKLARKCVRLSKELIHLPVGNHKHFSFIVERNNIISIGWNDTWKTHPLANRFNHRFNNIHAELSAIQRFPYPVRELQNYTLVNVRIMKNGNIGLSKPCPKCKEMLRVFQFHEVFYSTKLGEFHEF